MGNLTTLKARRLNTPGRYGDGRGLYLVVKPSGSKSWIQRLTLDGKRTDRGLGGFPTYSLAEARRAAESNRLAVQQGRSPWSSGKYRPETPESSDVPSFAEATLRFYAVNAAAGGWTGKRTARDWLNRIKKHVFPVVGSRQLDCITSAELRDNVLLPISALHAETARRLRDSIGQIYQFGIESEWVSANPVDRIPSKRLPRPTPVHHAALAWEKVPEFMLALDADNDVRQSTKECLLYVALTAARSGEARGATWREISDDFEVWSIPASRMKTREPHQVPLSLQSRALLRVIKSRVYGGDLPPDNDLLFPSSWGKPGKGASRELTWGALGNLMSLRKKCMGVTGRRAIGSVLPIIGAEEMSGASDTAHRVVLVASFQAHGKRRRVLWQSDVSDHARGRLLLHA